MRFEYNIEKNNIDMFIDLNKSDKTYIYDNILKLLKK